MVKWGEINSLENSLTYEFDENNLLTFNTQKKQKNKSYRIL